MTPAVTVVLIEPRNPLNIGAAARAMSNFGFTELRLVKPYDVAFREARSAVRAHHILEAAQVYSTVTEAVADVHLVVGTTSVGNRDLHAPLYRLETAVQMMRQQAAATRVALLFGSEKFGLSNDDLSHCHWLLRIPTREAHGSMNLGQAVSICLYELCRDGRAAHATPFDAPAVVTGADRARLLGLLLEMLRTAGYIQERTAVSGELKLRRLLHRLPLPASDAEAWLGMFRQIAWKLRQADGTKDKMALSARNQLAGTVQELKLGEVMAHVLVQVGEDTIESVITRTSAEELQLKKGDAVRVVVKSTEVMIQKD